MDGCLRLAVGVALMVAFGWSQPAVAQQDEESVDAHYEQGMENFYRGRYSLAIANFKRAYAIEPHGIFQYNISVAASKLGNLEEAHTAAAKALEEGGLPDDIEMKTHSRMRAYELAFAAGDVAEAMDAARQADEEPPAEMQSEPPVAQAEDKPPTSPPASPQAPSETGFGALGWSGAALSVVGVGGLITAGIFDANLGDRIDEYEQVRGSDSERAGELRSDISSDQTLGRWMVYGAGAAAVAGATLLTLEFVGDGSDSAGRVRVSPTAEGASVHLRWGF